jgi:beta-lactamase regulating signal transducer with metallopeptidase domain
MTLLLMLLLKSLLVFALAGAALLALRRASASARHLVCLLTLVSLLALPLFSLALPGWHLPMLQSRSQPIPAQEPTPARSSPTLPQEEGEKIARPGETGGGKPGPYSLSSPVGRPPAKQGGGFQNWDAAFWSLALIVLYTLGVLLAGLRPLLGLWGISRLRRVCVPAADTPSLTLAADCAAALGLQRLPQLCRADVCVPMTWGSHRPVVLLPSASVDWQEDRTRAVLLHEMAHVKRRDWTCHRLADFVCALYWFHPLVWLTARRLRAESELACDDLVLSSGIAAADYARHLLDIAQALPSSSRPTHSAIAMAHTSRIEGRITMILDKTQNRRTLPRRVLLFALIPVIATLVALAVLRPTVHTQTAPVPPVAPAPSASPQPTAALPPPTTISVKNNEIDGKPILVGLTRLHNPGSEWWSADGTPLPSPVYDTADKFAQDYAGPHTQNIGLAFRLPPAAQGVTLQIALPQSTGYSSDGTFFGKSQSDVGHTEAQQFASTNGARIVSAAFPPTLKKTDVRVGIASGTWQTTASETRSSGAVQPFVGATTALAGSVLFILTTPDETAKGLLLTLTTNSKEDIRIVAIDNHGQTLLPTDFGGESSSSGATNLNQIKAYFSQSLSQIKEFRVETRPFHWVEYKNVALQPVK